MKLNKQHYEAFQRGEAFDHNGNVITSLAQFNDARWITISLVNLSGLDNPEWDQVHSDPSTLEGVPVDVKLPEPIQQVYRASPDGADLQLYPLPWHVDGDILKVIMPILKYWGIIVIEMASEEKF